MTIVDGRAGFGRPGGASAGEAAIAEGAKIAVIARRPVGFVLRCAQSCRGITRRRVLAGPWRGADDGV